VITRRRVDFAVAAIALALAIYLTIGLWAAPRHHAIDVNSGDQALFEWLLGYGARAVVHGENPLYTGWLNAPQAVNLAVNTSITVYAVLFAPLTLWLGPSVSFTVILTLNLVGTAYAWYWLFQRHLGTSPVGAAIGGLFAGFAPAMVSHANAHLNWTAQWLVPLMIGRIVIMSQRRRAAWDGTILGLLIAICFSIAAEQLFFAALAGTLLALLWTLSNRHTAKERFSPVINALGVAICVSGVLLAYPLYMHFLGPYGFHGTGFDHRIHNEDLAAYGSFPARSLAGAAGLWRKLAPNPTEENSFFGLPLLIVSVAVFVRLRHKPIARAIAITSVVFAVLALGPQLRWMGHLTPLPMPELLVDKLPIFDAALPSRLALVVAPSIGALLALLITDLPAGKSRWVWVTALAVALVPLFPTPLLVRERPPVPHFISAGTWQQYVPKGGVLVPVPIPNDLLPDGQRWQAEVFSQPLSPAFKIPAGFFLGPGGPDGTGRIGPIPRYTQTMLETVAKTGQVPRIGRAERNKVQADLRYWGASVIVLADDVQGAHFVTHQPELLDVMTKLLGPAQRVDDVWLWRAPPPA
jgi:hypothetical protein